MEIGDYHRLQELKTLQDLKKKNDSPKLISMIAEELINHMIPPLKVTDDAHKAMCGWRSSGAITFLWWMMGSCLDLFPKRLFSNPTILTNAWEI